ncbi:MAG: adenylyltransferase/cytidyltransferase family protein, partial [Verrucomicrobiae bacterium]|nr:adenylyltransferase/cytidyltransferase family protein [Verrucomicrobiae bacterium]
MKSSPKRLALFGGTFDPIHNGHLDLALLARNECGLDELLFLPCARSPLKSSAPVASDEQRCQMVSLALAERGW